MKGNKQLLRTRIINSIFSLPESKTQVSFSPHWASSLSSVNFLHFDHLNNHWAKHGCDTPLSKLCLVILPPIQDDCHGFWLVEKLVMF
jgi:hypothetical protein